MCIEFHFIYVAILDSWTHQPGSHNGEGQHRSFVCSLLSPPSCCGASFGFITRGVRPPQLLVDYDSNVVH